MITVLTTTFNRAHTLPRLYESLTRQTLSDFEWLIVDDGSTDHSVSIISSFCAEGLLRIKWLCQENSGKHAAINSGVSAADGDWIFIVDSDDALEAGAIARITGDLTTRATTDVVGLCYRKAYFDGAIVGVHMPDSSSLCMHPSQAGEFFKGDLAYVFRRSSMLFHRFPVICNEKFVPELYIWNRIARDGLIVYFPIDAIYLCEYLEDGYSANFRANLRRNPKGFGLYYRAQIFHERSILRKIKCVLRTLQCSFYVFLKVLKR